MAGFFNFDSPARSLSLSKDDEDGGCLPELSFKERVTAFAVCFGLGMIIDMLSLGSAFGLITGNNTRFALTYTLGNILSLAGTTFLFGFKRQLKSVFDKKRRIASSIFLASMVMTLVSALVLHKPFLTLIFVVVQFCAFVWYIASYVPWGRDCLTGCIKKCCRGMTSE